MSTEEEPKKTIKEVTVPLSVDQIKEFFTDKNIIYFVNYANSDLKGVVFLTYLSNLDLPAEIDFEGSTYEQKSELFKIYMSTRNIIKSDTLRFNIAQILLDIKGSPAGDLFLNLAFTLEEELQFIKDNIALLKDWVQFLESTMIFAYSTISELEEKFQIKETCEVVDDPNFIGANIVNLFSTPCFMEFFNARPTMYALKYFRAQFEDYMFRGKNLFSYFEHPENTPYHLLLAFIGQEVSQTEFFSIGAHLEKHKSEQLEETNG